jgi:hypothetical protein
MNFPIEEESKFLFKISIFVASGRYSHMAWVSGTWELLLAPDWTFIGMKTPLGWIWGIGGLVMGLHTHMYA